MKAIVDCYYKEDQAECVLGIFNNWEDDSIKQVYTAFIEKVASYEPGKFYKRELPCILQILKQVDLDTIDTLLIDGYVFLDDEGRYGLGGHLYEALDKKIAIIGVAKTRYTKQYRNVKEVFRGKSKNPLFISAIGIKLSTAAENIEQMAGEYRMPHLVKQVDQLSRNII
jgi:deoxyribonuclease V